MVLHTGPFSEGEFVVNPIPRSAPRRSAVVTEPAAEVETVMLVTDLCRHGIDPRKRHSSSFDSDGKRVLMMFLGAPSDPLYMFGADSFTVPGFSNPSQT